MLIKIHDWLYENHPKVWGFIYGYFHNKHKIEVFDIATGVSMEASIPVNAFSYQCVVCGRMFRVPTESAYRQLDEGYMSDDVFEWMREKDK